MSTVKADRFRESTPGAGVTVEDLKAPGFGIPTGRTPTDLKDLLDKDGDYNPRLFQVDPTIDLGNGIVDAGIAGAATEALAGNGAVAWKKPGTYKHTVARNYTKIHRVNPGAIIKPSGANTNFANFVEAGKYQIFDTSAGLVTFIGSPQRDFEAAWWGIGTTGGVVDDIAALVALESVLPEGSTVHMLGTPHGIASTWYPGRALGAGKRGITYVGAANPFPDQVNTTRFIWIGAEKPVSGSNGSMLNGSAHLLSADNSFTAAMVGRTVWVQSCSGTSTGRHAGWLRTTVQAYNSAGDLTLANSNTSGANQVGRSFTVMGPEMIFLRSTNACTLKWIVALPNYDLANGGTKYTNHAFRVDISGEGVTGSNNFLIECKAYLNTHVPALQKFPYAVGFSCGDFSNGNQEFDHFIKCQSNGAPVERQVTTASITDVGAGKKRVHTDISITASLNVVGKRVRIAEAMGVRLPIDTTIAALVGPNDFDIADAAAVAVVSQNITIGESFGIGFFQGGSADLHRTQWLECTSQANETGFWQLNGSCRIADPVANVSECDIEVDAASMSTIIERPRGENSGQHLYWAGGSPLTYIAGDASSLTCAPNKDFITLVTGSSVTFYGTQFDDLPGPAPSTSRLFNPDNFSGELNLPGCIFVNITPAESGLLDFTSPVNSTLLEGKYVSSRKYQRTYLHYDSTNLGLSEALLVELVNTGSSPTRNTAIRGRALAGATDANKEYTGVTGEASGINAFRTSNQILRCFLAVQPVLDPSAGGYKATAYEGLRVTSPAIIAPGGTLLASGIILEPQAGPGIDAAHGIFQLGTGDLNKLLGRTVQAMPSTAPADADIDPGTSSFWIDQTGNFRKTRVRYSGGGYKTETSSGLV